LLTNSISPYILGCFWCLEAIFEQLKGVEGVISGYAGGHLKNPTYEEVCGKKTGHAEVVQVTYDKNQIGLDEILRIFFSFHDPTTLNRQGNDVGPQYRSIVLYHDPKQKEIAEQVKNEIENAKIWNNPIVTEFKKLDEFYVAEDYHQEYYRNNPNQPYCQFLITPKVAKFRKEYFDKLKNKNILI
jgi:peptide-methionine (S)-S-oxide reductase